MMYGLIQWQLIFVPKYNLDQIQNNHKVKTSGQCGCQLSLHLNSVTIDHHYIQTVWLSTTTIYRQFEYQLPLFTDSVSTDYHYIQAV